MRVLEYREALREAIDEEMTRDSTVIVMGEEVGLYQGAYKVTKGLLQKWGPERIIDTPIAELGFAGMAVGAAMTGLRPIVEFMSWNFSFVACDQIISNAAKMHYMSGGRFNVPVVFRGPNGAAAQVSCQHSHCVEAFYANLPGLIVVAPSTPADAKGLLKSSIRSNNPVLFLENELSYGVKGEVPDGDYLTPIGQAKIVRAGEHVTIVCYSRMLSLCLQAAEDLDRQGISCEVIDLRTIRPLDIGTVLGSVRKTHRLLCVEEGHKFAGISAEVGFEVQQMALDELDSPILRVTQLDTPMPYSRVLEAETLPNVARISAAVHSLLR
jgi:pyruvate dehydrogenase E1 component beta subunit